VAGRHRTDPDHHTDPIIEEQIAMYAIIRSGGKQYRVEPGQRLLVERLDAEVGAQVAMEPLLYRGEEPLFDAEALERVRVSARVLAHERGEKLRVFKFKPKRGYRRRTGHRQELTRIEIAEIAADARPAANDGAAGHGAAVHGAAGRGEGGAAPARAPVRAKTDPAGTDAKEEGDGS
jgi:large subunit ribosomal protein L21